MFSLKTCILVFSMSFIIVYYFFLVSCKNQNVIPTSSWKLRPKDEIDQKFPIVFYHEVYIDYRYSPPRLRVFSMNPCITGNEYIRATILKNNSNTSISIKLFGTPTEGECPWHWAKQCFYNSYIFQANLTKDSRSIQKVVLNLGYRKIRLKVKSVYPKKEEGLTICVQPVYWYSHFHNILLFIESWRSKGATKFLVYYHSSTKEVAKVLRYYETLGILTIIPWPAFGNLPRNLIGSYPPFDSSIYRVGHTLAQNLCILKMETNLGSIVDFDEVLTIRNINLSLLNYSNKELSKQGVGALFFPHALVQFEPRIENLDFSGTARPIFLDRPGPPKIVFNTSVVDIIVTHSIRSFIGKLEVAQADGALLHFRHNSYTEVAEKVKKPFKLFNKKWDWHLRNVKADIRRIFGDQIPAYNSTFLHTLNQCVDDIVETNKCRSTVFFCKQKMNLLTEWNIERRIGIFIA